MTASAKLRLRAGRRVSNAVWGLFVMGAGVLMVAAFSGYDIDFQLVAIIVLGALGAWILLSAAVSGIGRQKEIAQATAPVVEEPASAETDTELLDTEVDDTKVLDVEIDASEPGASEPEDDARP